MAQVKIYGLKDSLNPIKAQLSNLIHAAAVTAFHLPPEKRFHRFFPMEPGDFIYPADRSEAYLIIEISMFEGRTAAAKKQFYAFLFQMIHEKLNIAPQDVEITITETPKANWGIRGTAGDELTLPYRVDV
ncbi:tautomerase family protein [Paenibacillus sp. 1P07SE]|uniref:tautomerase family protein n=1 Tax=Paenibacillus sp. 1P07SE TaxID=3132209 RepID=UPI0039A51643